MKGTVANVLAAKQKTQFKSIEIEKPSATGYSHMAVEVISEKGGIFDASSGGAIEITREAIH